VSAFTQQELKDFEKGYIEETAETNVQYNEWQEMHRPSSTKPKESVACNSIDTCTRNNQ